MSNDDYSGARVIKNAWPEWISIGPGAWQRRWQFQFEIPIAKDEMSFEGMSEPNLDVLAQPGAAPDELVVTTTTRANAWSDDVFFFAAYRLFGRLEARFGRLRTIQGQPRVEWRPFR